MKKYKIILGIGLLVLLIVMMILAMVKNGKNRGDDYRIGIFADDGIAMASISKQRNMINFLKLSPDAKVWIPDGMGWYRSEVVKKILTQENKKSLSGKILFYNFGFATDDVVFLKNIDDWRNKFWWKTKIGELINKSEILDEDSDIKSDWLNEVMLRDFSETKVFDEDLKVSVVNNSGESGLANFVSDDLERLGFSVISVTTGGDESSNECQLLYGNDVDKTYSWSLLKKYFPDCKINSDLSLNSGEVELYLNSKFAEVIKYSSYKK